MIVELSDDAPQPWKDLIEGLALLSKHAFNDYPTHCEHDEMTIMATPAEFTPEEITKLDHLGFHVGQWTFYSFKFGSA